MNNKLPKKTHIKSKKIIYHIYNNGNTIKHQNIKLIWSYMPFYQSPFKFLIHVPKKLFKSAVQRNKIKRQITNIIRTNKNLILSKTIPQKTLLIKIIYSDTNLSNYNTILNNFTTCIKEIEI